MKLLVWLFVIQLQTLPISTDSLYSNLPSNKIERLEALIELGDSQKSNAKQFAQKVLQEAWQLSQELRKPAIGAEALKLLGVSYFKEGKYAEALDYFRQGLKISRTLGDSNQVANILFNQSLVYRETSQYEKALNIALHVLRLDEDTADSTALGYSYNSIGVLYQKIFDDQNAANYLYKSLSIREAINHQEGIGYTSINLGNLCIKEEKYDSALYYFNQAKYIFGEIGDSVSYAQSIYSLGSVNLNLKKLYESKNAYQQALEIFKRLNASPLEVFNCHSSLGLVMIELNDHDEALNHFNMALEIAENLKIPDLSLSIHFKIYYYQFSIKNYEKAIEHLLKFAEYREQVMDKEKAKDLANLQLQYDLEKRESENALLKSEKLLLENRAKMNDRLIIGSVIIFFIATIGLYYIFLLRSKSFKLAKESQTKEYEFEKAKLENELQINEIQHNKVNELSRLKFRFFTNISHEFRTPLTLILSPVNELIKKEGNIENYRNILFLIQRNANRLLRLVNELLEFQKVEEEREGLKLECIEMISSINSIKKSFDILAESQSINFFIKESIKEIYCWIDQEKLEKVFYNILSNSFKYTPKGGIIKISVDYVKADSLQTFDSVRVQVSDNGIGMNEETLGKIFNRFYKNKEKNYINHNKNSSGIGLSYAKELIQMHNGTILVDSKKGGGSCFSIDLPLKKHDKYTNILDKVEREFDQMLDQLTSIGTDDRPVLPYTTVSSRNKKQLPLILIIEDHSEMRQFISDRLQESFNIIEASEGQEGIKLAKKYIPELVISDVMMPIKNGIELCRELKTDELTNHIPIILITALENNDKKIQALEYQANDYINKPFDIKELEVKTTNLIEERKKLRKKIKEEMTSPAEAVLNSPKNDFVCKAISVAEDHLSDPKFDVNQFAYEMGLSRSVLYRKLRAVTDQSVNEFILNIRMKNATQLLKLKKLSIAEIAYRVGYNDPHYFSNSFRKRFGKSPSKYAEENV